MTSKNWLQAVLIYTRPRVLGMIFLGFSAGLPFLLVFSTLSAWLSDEGVARSVIGYFSWVGVTYSIKVFWAPVVDRLPLPILTRLMGKRRSWMLLSQVGIGLGLVGLGSCDAQTQLQYIAIFAIGIAFCSATQDIVVDAYRIEAVVSRYQGAMAASYVLGYRLALLVAGAGAFYIAAYSNWQTAYYTMALIMLVGIATTLIIKEPEHQTNQTIKYLEQNIDKATGLATAHSFSQRCLAQVSEAVMSPFVEFFNRNGKMGLLILAIIAVYKISDITMGVMANPFYLDLGFSKQDIANISKMFGFFMTIFGASLGGMMVVRYGIIRPLLFGSILIALTNFLFALLATSKPSLILLAGVVSADNLSGGLATSVFIAYLSSLTHTAYTATQYALFSSLMTLPAKLVGGFSGVVVDTLGYYGFFVYSAAIGLPAIILVAILLYFQQKKDKSSITGLF